MLAQRVIILSAAPATVFTEVINPLSYEERIGDLAENETFITLSEKLNALVHSKEA